MEIRGASRIAGIGAYLPPQRVHSDDLMREVRCDRFGIPDNYISKHIGITERRWADHSQNPSELATLASEVALRNSGVTADEIDLIVFAGISKDCEEPSTAHFVQNNLGAKNAICMDVSNACLGFLTAMSIADAFIAGGRASSVLVCTGEMQSRVIKEGMSRVWEITGKEEFREKLGFLTAGDGGGAMVIQASDGDSQGWKWLKFHSNGVHAHLCQYRLDFDGIHGQMLMKEISREIVEMHSKNIGYAYEKLEWTPGDVDKLYCHQVGERPHRWMVKLAGKEAESAPTTYEKFGNLTSATFPINMHINPPSRGEKLLLLGTGSGLSICQGGMIF